MRAPTPSGPATSARDLQKKLIDDYYARLNARGDGSPPVAYMFVGGNLLELLRAFGYEVVLPELVALNCAIKHTSLDNILAAEEMGYGADVCGYVKNDLGLHQRGSQTSFGRIPKADLLVCSFSGCYVYVKWFEALAELHQSPMVTFDVPYMRSPEIRREDIAYMVTQLGELIDQLERKTGRRLDMAQLRRTLAWSRKAEEGWVEYLRWGRKRPTPIEAYFEAVFHMFPINVLRGTPEAAEFYERVNDEVRQRVRDGDYPVPDERHRLLVEGVPPYPYYRTFWDYLKGWGAVSAVATYPKVGGLFDRGFLHDPSRPLESIAEYSLSAYVNQSWPLRRQIIQDYVREYEVDAVLIHGIKSCRSFTAGQGDLRDFLTHDVGVPTLYLESDHEDPRYFSPAQVKNRVDAFFESLGNRRAITAAVGG